VKDHERAMQAWSALELAAANRQTLTYSMLSQLVGVPARGLAHILDHVALYCRDRGYPSLTAIVMRKDVGQPGLGFWAVPSHKLARELMRVFEFDWLAKAAAPTPELLEELRSKAKAQRGRG